MSLVLEIVEVVVEQHLGMIDMPEVAVLDLPPPQHFLDLLRQSHRPLFKHTLRQISLDRTLNEQVEIDVRVNGKQVDKIGLVDQSRSLALRYHAKMRLHGTRLLDFTSRHCFDWAA